MPPKPSKDKKDDKGAEEKSGDSSDCAYDMAERELMIRFLRNKLGRYQNAEERLTVDNLKLADELKEWKITVAQITDFLSMELKARSATSATLEEQLAQAQQQMDNMKKSFELERERLQGERTEEKQVMERHKVEHQHALQQTRDWLDNKDQVMKEISDLKSRLIRTENDHTLAMSDRERKFMADLDKSRKEANEKVERAKAEVRNQINEQLESTTKRTIVENERLATELGYQSRQTEKLLKEQRRLMEEIEELRRKLQVSTKTQEAMSRRNHTYQKTIKTLLLKVKEEIGGKELEMGLVDELAVHVAQLEAELQETRDRHAGEMREMQLSLGDSCYEVRMLREQLRAAGLPVRGELDHLMAQPQQAEPAAQEDGAGGTAGAATEAADGTSMASPGADDIGNTHAQADASSGAPMGVGVHDAANRRGTAASSQRSRSTSPLRSSRRNTAAIPDKASATGRSSPSLSVHTLCSMDPAAATIAQQLVAAEQLLPPGSQQQKGLHIITSHHNSTRHHKSLSRSTQQQVQAHSLMLLTNCLADLAARSTTDNSSTARETIVQQPQVQQLAQQLMTALQERMSSHEAAQPSLPGPASPSSPQPSTRGEGTLPPIHQNNTPQRAGTNTASTAMTATGTACLGANSSVLPQEEGLQVDEIGGPNFEDLISKLLSEVRPWGKSTGNSKVLSRRAGSSPTKSQIF